MSKVIKATYTIKEVSEILGIGRSLAYEMAHSNQIPVKKLGKRFVVPKAALEEFLKI
jgi:excisionase family DNA binding protein